MDRKYFRQKYPKCPKIYQPNLSSQAQKFQISLKKKASLGVRSIIVTGNSFVVSLSKHANIFFVFAFFIHDLFTMNGPSKLHGQISSKHFFGLKLCFQCSSLDWYICLNLIDLSKKPFCLFKTGIKAKKLFARNVGMQFRRAVHIQSLTHQAFLTYSVS